jgi:hypothetical protein
MKNSSTVKIKLLDIIYTFRREQKSGEGDVEWGARMSAKSRMKKVKERILLERERAKFVTYKPIDKFITHYAHPEIYFHSLLLVADAAAAAIYLDEIASLPPLFLIALYIIVLSFTARLLSSCK